MTIERRLLTALELTDNALYDLQGADYRASYTGRAATAARNEAAAALRRTRPIEIPAGANDDRFHEHAAALVLHIAYLHLIAWNEGRRQEKADIGLFLGELGVTPAEIDAAWDKAICAAQFIAKMTDLKIPRENEK